MKAAISVQASHTMSAKTFNNWITADGDFPAASGRYHLYVCLACPFAHRTLMGRALKGLDDVISITVVDPHMAERGWTFSDKERECQADINGKETLQEVYELAEKGFAGDASVPMLWDKEKKRVVNTESSDILRMLSTGVFDKFCKTKEQRNLDLYPTSLRKEIDDMNVYVFEHINDGVYRAGLATTQEDYNTAVASVFQGLDKLEERLSKTRYLMGKKVTEADIRLVVSLFRFDMCYHGLFKCNLKMLKEFPNLWAYTRDMYQLPGVAATVNLYHINTHYWWAVNSVNPSRIVPVGPKLDFKAPHKREKVGK